MVLNTTSIGQYSLDFLTIFGIGWACLVVMAILLLICFRIPILKSWLNASQAKIKIPFQFCLGLILGMMFGFLSWLDYWLQMPIFTFVNFSLLAVFAYRYSLWIFLGAFGPEIGLVATLFVYWMPHFSNNTFEVFYLAYVALAYLIFVIIGAIIRIYSMRSQSLLIFISSFIGFIILFFMIWVVTNLSLSDIDFSFFGIMSLDVLFSWLSFLTYYWTLKLITNFVASYKTVLRSGNYAEPNIYNQNYGILKINEMIKNNQFNFGFVITIKCLNEPEIVAQYGLSALYKIKKTWNQLFIKHFPFANSLQFINENHDYCFFVGFQHQASWPDLNSLYAMNQNQTTDNAALNQFRDYFLSVAHQVIYNNTSINLKLKSFLALYNLHSCKIKDLLAFNQETYLAYHHDNAVPVMVYDPSHSYNPYANFDQAQSLESFLNESQFDVKLIPVVKYPNQSSSIYQTELLNLGLLLFNKQEIYDAGASVHLTGLLKQYLAIQIFQKVNTLHLNQNQPDFQIIIDYDWSILNVKSLNIHRYLTILANYNLQPNQVILNLDLQDLNDNSYSSVFISRSLHLFRQNDIKIAFSNINEQTILRLSDFWPDYAYFDKQQLNSNQNLAPYYACLCDYLESKKVEIIS